MSSSTAGATGTSGVFGERGVLRVSAAETGVSRASGGSQAELRGVVFALIGGIGWGFSGACAQFLLTTYGLDTLWITVVRLLGAGVVLMAVCLLRFRKNLRALWCCPRDALHLVLFAMAGIVFCQVTYLMAIQYSNAATATVLQYIGPVLIVVLACLRGRRLPSAREAVAVLCVILGTFLVATHGDPSTMALSPQGLTWGLLAAVGVALYSLLPVNLILRYGAVPVVGSGMLVGGVVMFVATQAWAAPVQMDATGWLALLCGLVLVGTVVGYTFYLEGVKVAGAPKASLVSSIEVVSATLFAVLWLGTAFAWIDIVGFAFIMATVFLLAKRGGKE